MNLRAITVFFWVFLIATATIEGNGDDAHADTGAHAGVALTEAGNRDEGSCQTAASRT